jgi:aminopeptidase N
LNITEEQKEKMKKLIVLTAAVLCIVAIARADFPMHETKVAHAWPGFAPLSHDSAHAYDIRCYRINMNLPMNNAAMGAHERITVTSHRAGLDTLALHMQYLTCDSVKIGGSPMTFTTPTGLVVINLDRAYNPGESLDVHVWFHRAAGNTQQGFYWYSRASSGHHVICYSTTEPADSRGWFPCFDEPWDKAEQGCAIAITVPETLSACSNGLLDSVTSNTSAHTKTFWWSEHNPIATYLMTFAASKWTQLTQWAHRAAGDSFMIQNFIWPEDSTLAVSAFAHNVDMITFFMDANRYGAYPFEKYGMVEAYPFQWGGMENQTMTMVHHQWIQYGDDQGISHEMSHQWWGDRVTCLDWRNIWLNEGFAQYSDALYEYHENGRSSFISLMSSYASSYYSEEASQLRPVYDPPYPDHLFDYGHTYCKGAWLQHMLRFVEGDTVFASPGTFFQALRAYGDSFSYGGAVTDDYRRIIEQYTGLDLGWYFNEWIYQAGYPVYTVNWHSVAESPYYRVYMDIAQSNGAQAPTCFHQPIQIRLHAASRDTLVTIPVTSNPMSTSFLVSANVTSILCDPGTWVLGDFTTYVGVDNATASELARPLVAAPSLFRTSSSIRYTTAHTGSVNLAVFDAAGKKVRTLASGPSDPGSHHATWDGRSDAGTRVAPGIYFCRLNGPSVNEQIKLVLLSS